MRPDVATFGTRIASHCSCQPGIAPEGGLPSATRIALVSAWFSVSDPCAAFLPRSGVLSRHDTNVLVTPRDYRRRRASPRGWRDRCRSQGLGPSGRRSWQPSAGICARNINCTPEQPACQQWPGRCVRNCASRIGGCLAAFAPVSIGNRKDLHDSCHHGNCRSLGRARTGIGYIFTLLHPLAPGPITRTRRLCLIPPALPCRVGQAVVGQDLATRAKTPSFRPGFPPRNQLA